MSESIGIYIVEDDLITRSQIKGYLHSAGYRLAGMATDAETAWSELQNKTSDIAILDINLSGEKDGLWLASQISQQGKMPYIFLTAHNDKKTIQEAAQIRPNGYLIKPFTDMGLYSAIEVAMQNFSSGSENTKTNDDQEKQVVVNDSLFIKVDHLLVKVKFEDLLYVMSDGNYLELHLKDQMHIIRSKLSTFLEQLPADKFMQVHLRYLVNKENVQSVGKNFLMINEKEIPVSKTYQKAILRNVQLNQL